MEGENRLIDMEKSLKGFVSIIGQEKLFNHLFKRRNNDDFLFTGFNRDFEMKVQKSF